ncbi:6963_t:CDS:1 [Scutellospora calospora]|uniref:6963_t:CDS:1 n=1 Tax=Scutellospora calospora TaxID=85575 RepID=A0ACA9K186_9GLOM|nr:6963_t:CDS:1 [Scutellospora calospora]
MDKNHSNLPHYKEKQDESNADSSLYSISSSLPLIDSNAKDFTETTLELAQEPFQQSLQNSFPIPTILDIMATSEVLMDNESRLTHNSFQQPLQNSPFPVQTILDIMATSEVLIYNESRLTNNSFQPINLDIMTTPEALMDNEPRLAYNSSQQDLFITLPFPPRIDINNLAKPNCGIKAFNIYRKAYIEELYSQRVNFQESKISSVIANSWIKEPKYVKKEYQRLAENASASGRYGTNRRHACSECQRSRIKCVGSGPCERCVEKKFRCIFIPQKKRGPKTCKSLRSS